MLVKIFYQISLISRSMVLWGMTREECRNGFETSGHVLWGCRCAKDIWELVPFFGVDSNLIFLEFMDLLWFLIFSRERDDGALTLVVTIAWVMWSNRNNKRHGGKVKTNQVVIQRSVNYIREYHTANENTVIAKDVGCQNWIPPADHVYKVNVGKAIFQTQHQAGIGF